MISGEMTILVEELIKNKFSEKNEDYILYIREKLTETFADLNVDEVKFLVKMFEKLIIIDELDYPDELQKLFAKIIMEKNNKYYITSINSYDYLKEGKKILRQTISSNFITYLSKTSNFKVFSHKIGMEKVKLLDGKSTMSKEKNVRLIIVDDYIGSGETVLNYINELITVYNIEISQIIIVTISINRKTLNTLEYDGFNVIYTYVIDRFISDIVDSDEQEKCKKLYEVICNKKNIKDREKYGYKNSESLIYLARIPNNVPKIFSLIERNI